MMAAKRIREIVLPKIFNGHHAIFQENGFRDIGPGTIYNPRMVRCNLASAIANLRKTSPRSP
jgi:hypothetical protein